MKNCESFHDECISKAEWQILRMIMIYFAVEIPLVFLFSFLYFGLIWMVPFWIWFAIALISIPFLGLSLLAGFRGGVDIVDLIKRLWDLEEKVEAAKNAGKNSAQASEGMAKA